jgi:AbrB family looped-hinge helix DNA binding protein
METICTIDGAGRLVVPKAMRTRLGIRKDTRLLLRELDGRLVIEPLLEDATPVEVDDLLVIPGRLEGAVPDHRDLRDQRIAALSRASR